MSPCPTDGPVLKSILGLYRPAADCLSSFLLFLNLLSLSISTNLLFSFFHTQCCLILLYFSLSLLSSVNLLCPISLRLSLLSLIAGPIQPSFSFFFWPLMVSSHKSLCQLSRSVSLYHSPSPLSCRSFFYCPIHIVSHSLGVSLSGS